MRKLKNIIYASFILLSVSCDNKPSDSRIAELLKSRDNRDLIIGAFEAGERGDKKFIPLLLSNADNPSASTNIRFKGFSVYQEKMNALRKILKVDPPVPIKRKPDSLVIKFYENYVSVHHVLN